MSDPSGLRAGVERLIAEPMDDMWTDEFNAGVWMIRGKLRALLAKHPPTPPAEESLRQPFTIRHLEDRAVAAELEAQQLRQDMRELDGIYNRDGIASENARQIERIFDRWNHGAASPPSDPSPAEQEKP